MNYFFRPYSRLGLTKYFFKDGLFLTLVAKYRQFNHTIEKNWSPYKIQKAINTFIHAVEGMGDSK